MAETTTLRPMLLGVSDGAEIVDRYKKPLADIARGFGVLKPDSEIELVCHRLPDRIRALAQICCLALDLHRLMRKRLKASD